MNSCNLQNSKVNVNALLILIGCLLGLSFSFVYFGLLIAVIFFIMAIFIYTFVYQEDRSFLFKLFIVALAIRLVVCIFSYFFFLYVGKGGWVFGDEWGISTRAWQIAQFLKGFKTTWIEYPPGEYSGYAKTYLHSLREYGSGGYTYWVGFLYFLFGYLPVIPKLVNTFLGSFNGILAYLISKEIFDRRVAKLSVILVIFFPSLMLWSVLNLKDTMFIFLLMSIFYSFIKLQKSRNLIYLLALIITILLESTMRPGIWIIIVISFLFSYIILLGGRLKRVIIILSLASLLFFVSINKSFFEVHKINFISKIISRHVGHVHTEGISYKLLPEKYYVEGAKLTSITFVESSIGFFKAWFYFILSPLLWNIHSKSELLSFPQMIIWYLLLMFSLLGIALSLRYKVKSEITLIIYLLLITTGFAAVSGNVGTTFRQRDMVTPLFLIFSAYGIINLLRR